jgi:hypothetical protein
MAWRPRSRRGASMIHQRIRPGDPNNEFRICSTTIQRTMLPRVEPGDTALTPALTTEVWAEDCFGAVSLGLSGSPLVHPPDPVAATAVETWTHSVVVPTKAASARTRVTVFKNFGAIAL